MTAAGQFGTAHAVLERYEGKKPGEEAVVVIRLRDEQKGYRGCYEIREVEAIALMRAFGAFAAARRAEIAREQEVPA